MDLRYPSCSYMSSSCPQISNQFKDFRETKYVHLTTGDHHTYLLNFVKVKQGKAVLVLLTEQQAMKAY